MTGRIAHRPHYRTIQKPISPSIRSEQSYLRTRWQYRNRSIVYEKHTLGYQLSLLPFRHRLMQHLVPYQAF
jgi:hypothetical protein